MHNDQLKHDELPSRNRLQSLLKRLISMVTCLGTIDHKDMVVVFGSAKDLFFFFFLNSLWLYDHVTI